MWDVNQKILAYAIIVGAVITVITGLINNTPLLQAGSCVPSTWYGWPLIWLNLPLIEGGKIFGGIDISNFIIDTVFWTIITAIALSIKSNAKRRAHKSD